MRWATPQPCIGSRASLCKISKSSVPCKRSVDGGIFFPSMFDNRLPCTPVECQGKTKCTRSSPRSDLVGEFIPTHSRRMVTLTFSPQNRYTTLVWRFLPVVVEPDVRPELEGLER